MRIRLFILTSLILLYLLTSQAFSQSSSQPIQGYDEVSGTLIVGGGSMSDQAQASRTEWAAHSNAGILNTPISASHSSGAAKPERTEKPGSNQAETSEPAVSNGTSPKQIETISMPGNWSLELADNVSRNATLTLFQNGETVFGKGNILEDNNALTVAAGGSITGNELDLDLITLEKLGLYKLSMTIDGDSAIGNYTAFSTIGSPSTGPAKGLRT